MDTERLLARLTRLMADCPLVATVTRQVVGFLVSRREVLDAWPEGELVAAFRLIIQGGTSGDLWAIVLQQTWEDTDQVPARFECVHDLFELVGRLGLRQLVAAITRAEEADDGSRHPAAPKR